MSVTIRTVAREAGVSVATVSRVFTGSGPVGAATRAQVQAVARALRYVPNGAARSLTTARTHTIGVLLPDLHGEYFSEVIRGVDLAARGAGYHLLVSGFHDSVADVVAALRAMSGRVDGLVVMAPDLSRPQLEANLPAGLPVVLLNAPGRFDAADGYGAFAVDNEGGARAMVRLFAAAGHTRIAILRGADGNHDAAGRLRGYHVALAEAGLDPDPALEPAGHFTEDGGTDAMRALLALDDRPTAVFAANDAMALGALVALREAGLRVPEHVALAGFDDVPAARHANPPLSSVHVAMADMGGQALRTLLDAVAPGTLYQPCRTVFPATPVLRASCGCAP